VQSESRIAFPRLTGRELPEHLRYQTSVEKAGSPDVAVNVTTASGEHWPVDSDGLRKALERRFGKSVFLLCDHRGPFDVAAVSLITLQTVARIAEETGTQENPPALSPQPAH
jgi:hypothetical protein